MSADGAIRRDVDTGQWIATLNRGHDPATGKRTRWVRKRSTRREAQAALRELRERAEADQPGRDSTTTLTAWAERWADTGRGGRRQTTWATYTVLMRTVVLPTLGHHRLRDLRPSHVAAWLTVLDADGGPSRSTQRQALTILRACLDDAVRDRLLATNPAADVTRPTLPRTEAHSYTPAQVAALRAAADGHRLAPLLGVMLGTGLRRGEALALRWEHVDVDAGVLHVRGTLVRTASGLTVNPPKTAHGWRTVPLSAPVLAALKQQRVNQAADHLAAGVSWIATGYVFTTEAGTPLDPRNVGRWFTTLARGADVGGSLHTLRHTALSAMADGGVPLVVVSRVAGHESIATTVDLYGHVADDSMRAAVTGAAERLGLGT